MATFREILQEFTGSRMIGIYMIHLDRAVERISYIQSLETALKTPLPLFSACVGTELVAKGHPTLCLVGSGHRTPGDIGCTVSHITICKDALARGYEYVMIFEDDCELKRSLEEMRAQLSAFRNLGLPWDLFLLGGHVTGMPLGTTGFSKADKFFLTHACLLNRTFMTELVALYDSYCDKNLTFAIDGIYSNVLQSKKATAYGFTANDVLFGQYNGIYSYIIEGIRVH
jgi:hypothetical protein